MPTLPIEVRPLAAQINATIVQERMVATLAGGFGVLALVLSSVGLYGLLAYSVAHRSREIGIRMAIGATEKEVLLQFLVEAAMLSAFGGLAGITLGLLGAAGLAPVLNVPFTFQLSTVLTAFAFSAMVGVVFGFMPARRAARLDPIEALRHE